jgi:hypothetical protein
MNKLQFSESNNQKIVTQAAVFSTGERILTTSLDQHLKVYNTLDMTVTY